MPQSILHGKTPHQLSAVKHIHFCKRGLSWHHVDNAVSTHIHDRWAIFMGVIHQWIFSNRPIFTMNVKNSMRGSTHFFDENVRSRWFRMHFYLSFGNGMSWPGPKCMHFYSGSGNAEFRVVSFDCIFTTSWRPPAVRMTPEWRQIYVLPSKATSAENRQNPRDLISMHF